MACANQPQAKGVRIGYVAESSVIHIHEESWSRVKIRYEREAIALQSIMPEIHVNFTDFLRYFASGVYFDCRQALADRVLLRRLREIFLFRLMQYWGTYCGNNEHRRLSFRRKEAYFYPR